MSKTESQSFRERAFSGIFWTASGWGVSAVFQLVFGIALARLLGPTVLGIYAAALVVIRFSNLLGDIGIGPALVQREPLSREHLRTGLTLSLGLGAGIGTVTWLGAGAIADFYRMPEIESVVRTLAFVFPLQAIAMVPRTLLQRNLSFRKLALVESVAYVLGFGTVGIVLALTGFGLTSLIAATLSHTFLQMLLLSFVQPFPKMPMLDRTSAADLLGFGGGITLSGIFSFFALQGDKLVVGRLLGAVELGLYSRAYSLMATPTRLYAKIERTAIFPLLSRAQGNPERIRRGFEQGLALNAICVLPLSAVLFVTSPELIHVLLGEEWLGSVQPFRILVLFLVFRGADRLCSPVIMAAARVYRLAVIQALFAVLILAGAWWGSSQGLGGVAAGVAAAFVLHSVLLLQYALEITGHSWSMVVRAWGRPLALAVGAGFVTWLAGSTMRWLEAPALWVLIVPIALVSLLAATALWVAPKRVLGNDVAQMLGRLEIVRTIVSRLSRSQS